MEIKSSIASNRYELKRILSENEDRSYFSSESALASTYPGDDFTLRVILTKISWCQYLAKYNIYSDSTDYETKYIYYANKSPAVLISDKFLFSCEFVFTTFACVSRNQTLLKLPACYFSTLKEECKILTTCTRTALK